MVFIWLVITACTCSWSKRQNLIKDNKCSNQSLHNWGRCYSKSVELTVSKGAKPAFQDARLQYARIGDFKVLNAQIIGLDGKRIQILEKMDE